MKQKFVDGILVRRVPRYPNFWVSRKGRVWSDCRGGVWKKLTLDDGYFKAVLSHQGKQKGFRVHVLVARCWIGKCPKGEECRHLDDIRTNNHYKNLVYGTRSENVLDAFRNGRQYTMVLDEDQVAYIRRRLRGGKRGIQTELASELGVSTGMISNIYLRKHYEHV